MKKLLSLVVLGLAPLIGNAFCTSGTFMSAHGATYHYTVCVTGSSNDEALANAYVAYLKRRVY